MRAARTLSIYTVREVLQYTLIGVAAITILLVTRNLVQMLDRLLGAGFALSDFLAVFRLLGISLAIYTLPISFLFGVLLAFSRMTGDVEITAMRACGISLAQLTIPIAIVGLSISVATGKLATEVQPAARRDMTATVAKMLMRGAAIEPGRFTRIGERLLYVDERGTDGDLHGIVISDRSNLTRPLIIFAESGEMSLDEYSGALKLRLRNGDIHVEPPEDAEALYQRISFATFDYEIDVAGFLAPRKDPRAREMSLDELRETIARIERGDLEGLREDIPTTYAVHLHRRFAAPLAPLLFALVGVPLGMRRQRGARSWGALLCALVAFGYYMLQSFCEFMAEQAWLPVVAAAWVPNLVFAGLAAWLLSRARYGR
ncbi:MAG TPA: LptF/LptG family permease [Myxococcota bacterium]